MKKYKSIVVLLLIAVVVSAFVACGSNGKKYEDKEVTITQAVTDENGQAVTKADGEVVTETQNAVVATKKNGQSVTEAVTDKKGVTVTNKNGEKVTQAVTTKQEKTTKKKAEKTTSTTKKELPITTTTEPSTNENELIMHVIVPYFSAYDENEYTLTVSIDGVKKALTYSFVGCKGQRISIVIPKQHKNKNATFSVNDGNSEAQRAKIKDGAEVKFQTMIVVEGEDD